MNPTNSSLKDLLEKYFLNTISEKEKDKIDQFYDTAVHHEELNSVEFPFNELYLNEQMKNEFIIWKKIIYQRKRSAQIRRIMQWTIQSAAIFVIVFGIWWIHHYLTSNKDEWTRIAATQLPKNIRLPDQSIIWLSKNSVIDYSPNQFNEYRRIKLIHGEAIFRVTKDTAHPFFVETNGISTQVLGTTFRVHHDTNSSATNVALLEGSVQLLESNNQLIYRLKPGDQVVYDKKNKSAVVSRPIYLNEEFIWMSENINLSGKNLEQVKIILEKRFDVDIQIDPNIKSCIVNGVFQNESIDEILSILTELLSASLIKKGNTFYISGQKCK